MTPTTYHRFTASTREEFLDCLRRGYTIAAAARAVGFSRRAAYNNRDDDEQFAAEWEDAIEEGKDFLEQEARRRAIEGTVRPVFYQGEECGGIREYSDTLLLAMLKAKRIEYRDKVDLNANVNVSVTQVLEEARRRLKSST